MTLGCYGMTLGCYGMTLGCFGMMLQLPITSTAPRAFSLEYQSRIGARFVMFCI